MSTDLPHDSFRQLEITLRVDLDHVGLGVTQDGLDGTAHGAQS